MSQSSQQPTSNDQLTRGRFLGDIAFRFAAQAMGAIKGLVFLPLIARSFGQSAYGIWSQVALAVVLVQPFVTLQIEQALVRYLSDVATGVQRRNAVWSCNWMVWLVGALLAGTLLIFREATAVALFGKATLSGIALCYAFMLLSQSLLSIGIAYYRANSRLKSSTLLQAGTSLGSIIVVVLGVLVFGASLRESILAWTVTVALGAIIGQLGILRSEGISFAIQPAILRTFLRYSLPLVPAFAAVWIIEYSDRLFIVHLLGLPEAGVYSGAYRIAQVMRMLVAPIAFVLLPTVLRLRKQGEERLAKALMREVHIGYLIVGCGVAALLIGRGPEILRILGSTAFEVSQGLLALLVLGELLLALRLLYTQYLYLSERTLAVMLVVAGTAGLNIVANLLLIPSLGILGAAIATFASYAAQWLIMLRLAKASELTQMPRSVLLRLLIGAAAAYATLRITASLGAGLSLLGVVLAGLLYVIVLWSSREVRDVIRHMVRPPSG